MNSFKSAQFIGELRRSSLSLLVLTGWMSHLWAAPLTFNFSALDGPVQALGQSSSSAEDTQALLVLKAWAKEEWSILRPRSVLPEQIEARNALLAREAELLYSFTTNYPASLWTPAIQLELGKHYRRRGRYSRALLLWESGWEATKNVSAGYAKEVADATLANYLALLCSLGRSETLATIFSQTQRRRMPFGSDGQSYRRSLEAWTHMGLNPAKSYRCGTYALGRVAEVLTNSLNSTLGRAPSPAAGFSLKELADLAEQWAIAMVAVNWGDSPQLVVPSVIHWKENHYAAIIEQHGRWFKVADPTLDQHPVMLRYEDIVAEASGYFLVPKGRVPVGWRRAERQESQKVYGRGYATVVEDSHDEPGCPYGSGPGGVPGSAPGNSGGGGGGGCGGMCVQSSGDKGMPFWAVSEPYINVWIFDTPLSYQPSVGAEVAVRLMWRERGLDLFTWFNPDKFSAFGGGWCSPWRAAVTPANFDDTGYGVGAMFLGSGSHLYAEFYNWNTISEHNYFNNTKLERIVNPSTQEETRYEVHYPDGSRDVYGLIATNPFGYVRRYCLTGKVDPQGHQTRIEYFDYDPEQENTVVKRIVDADGHALDFTYLGFDLGYTFKTNLVGQISDWAGRSVKFNYDSNDFTLNEIVDAADMTNRFGYDGGSWITNMVTPYGTTRFEHYQIRANHAETRYVTISAPDQAQQRYWYESADATVPDPLDPLGDGYILPSGTPFGDSFATWVWDRNSYHWDTRNFDYLSLPFRTDPANNPPTARDRLVGRGRHWLGTQLEGGADAHTLGAQRDPSPDGFVEGQLTWYNYEGKSGPDYQGTQILPAVVSRVMPDGTTWYEQQAHNDYGLLTERTEKWVDKGATLYRTHTFVYDDNGIDLLAHYGPEGALIVGYGYEPAHPHLPAWMANALNEITRYNYDELNRLVTIQTPSDLRTTNSYGGDGYLQTVVEAMGTTPFRTNEYTYLYNYPRTHTDERNLTLTFSYDNLGRLTRTEYPDATYEQDIYTVSTPYPKSSGGTAIIDRTGHRDRLGKWTFYSWTANRWLASVTDSKNNVTAYGYCTCGSLDYVTNAWNTPVQEVTFYTYDNQGNQTGAFPPFGAGIVKSYDLGGRLMSVADAAGTVTNFHDNLGRLTAVADAGGQASVTVYDASDRVLIWTDGNGVSVTNSYDDLGRLRMRAYPDSGVETWGYTQNVSGPTSYANQLGKVWTYAYDAAGRQTNEVGMGVYTNSLTYGPAGDLLTLTDGKNQVTTWNYDEYGRVTNKLDQAGVEILRYSYDANGQVTNRWSVAKGNTAYAFDDVGNLALVDYPSSADVTLQYDALNRLTNMVDGAGVTTYTYYPGGLMHTEEGPWAGDSVTYGYNNARQRGSLTIEQPDGSWTQYYSYDAAHRLTNIVSPAGAFTYNYTAGQASRLPIRLDLPNGSYITNTYDNVARLSGTHLENSLDVVLNSHAYLYNQGNQRATTVRTDGSYVNYAYDDIGQLTSALGYSSGGVPDSNEQKGYGYDAASNLNVRTNNDSGSTTTFTVDVKNQLTGGPSAAYGYDDNGNLTSSSGGYVTYSYTDENQLATVSYLNTYRTDFVYDGLGRLRKRIEYAWNPTDGWVASGETRYIYDGNVVIQERDGSDTPTVSYTRGIDLSGSFEGAGGIGGLLARSHGYSSGSWTVHNFYHADGNGNVTMLIDNNAPPTVAAAYRYDSFGNTISSSGSLAGANVYRFSSKEIHANSGLYYYGYRFYDPNLQRWINRDPIEESDGPNLYAFVSNNPISWFDFLGLEGSNCCAKVTVVVEVPGPNVRGKLNRKGMDGHSGVAVGDEYYDYGPQPRRGGSLFGSPGQPWWDSNPRVNSSRNASLQDVLNHLDMLSGGNDTYTVTADVDPGEASMVEDYWKDLYKHPGTYRFYARQCTTTACKSLRDAGLIKGRALKPQTFLKLLRNNLKHTCGDKKGRAADVKKVHSGSRSG